MAVERSQKVENLTTEFRAKVRQNTPKSQISNPHISPKWGPIPPSKKKFSQGHQHYKRHKSDWGCGPRKGVNPKRAPPPNFRPVIFSKTLRQISPKSLFKAKGYLKCVNLYFGPDLTTGSPGKLPTVFGVFRVWGQNPKCQPGIRPPIFVGSIVHY